MSGFGRQPAGRQAGFGEPVSASPLTGEILQDPTTGQSQGARYINPRTGDYELDPYTGRLRGMKPSRQAVQLSVHTRMQSAVLKGMGQRLYRLQRITTNFEAAVLNEITVALKPLIDARIITLLGFSAFKAGRKDGLPEGRTFGRVRWRDLTTNEEHEEIV